MTLALPSRRLLATIATIAMLAVTREAGAQGAPAPTVAPGADSVAVVRVVERFHAALASGDSATAIALLVPDVVVLESGGAEDMAEYRSHHLPADIEFARAVDETRAVVRVTVRGDLAWAAGTSTAKGQFRGRPVNSTGAELLVLARTADGWRIAAIHWSSRRRA